MRNMDDTKQTVAGRIIDKCGGPKKIADALDLDVSSIHKWKYPTDRGGTGGLVPTNRQQELMRWARRVGIDLAPEDFFEAPERAQ